MEKEYLKKDSLGQLIASLSLAETRYFYQYVKSLNHQTTPYYLEIFDSFSKPKSQAAPLPEMQSKKALTNAKARLYQTIMQSLRNYHQYNSVELDIQNIICEVEILYNRGLPKQSIALLYKAKTSASANENFGLLLQILNWERKLNIVLNDPTRANHEIAVEEREILNSFNEIIELENIYGRVIEIKKKNGYVKGAAKTLLEELIIDNPHLANPASISSKRGVYYYHFINSQYHWLLLNHKEAYQYSKKLLSDELQNISPREYLEGVLQHVTSCMGLGLFDETIQGLKLAEDFVAQKRFNHSTNLVLRVFYFQICYKLIVYSYMGLKSELAVAIEEANSQIEIYKKQISVEMKLVIYGNLRNAYIAHGDQERAEQLLVTLLYKESKFVRKDVYNDLFLSKIFSHLAAMEYDILPTAAASAHRQFKQEQGNENQFEVALKIASILMKNHNFLNLKEKNKVLVTIKTILEEYIASFSGLNKFHEIYSFYLIWTDSLLQSRPFDEIAAARYKEHLGKNID